MEDDLEVIKKVASLASMGMEWVIVFQSQELLGSIHMLLRLAILSDR
jgi:hypothetical protein